MKKLYRPLITVHCLLLLTGCASWNNVRSSITTPDGQIYETHLKSDGLATLIVKPDGTVEISFDYRGRPGMIEQALGIMFMNLPDVEVQK